MATLRRSALPAFLDAVLEPSVPPARRRKSARLSLSLSMRTSLRCFYRSVNPGGSLPTSEIGNRFIQRAVLIIGNAIPSRDCILQSVLGQATDCEPWSVPITTLDGVPLRPVFLAMSSDINVASELSSMNAHVSLCPVGPTNGTGTNPSLRTRGAKMTSWTRIR